MSQYRDLADAAIVIFDNRPEGHTHPCCGVTSGRNADRVLNGTMLHSDIQNMITEYRCQKGHPADEKLLLVFPEGCTIPTHQMAVAYSWELNTSRGHGDVLLFDTNHIEAGGVVALDVRWSPLPCPPPLQARREFPNEPQFTNAIAGGQPVRGVYRLAVGGEDPNEFRGTFFGRDRMIHDTPVADE